MSHGRVTMLLIAEPDEFRYNVGSDALLSVLQVDTPDTQNEGTRLTCLDGRWDKPLSCYRMLIFPLTALPFGTATPGVGFWMSGALSAGTLEQDTARYFSPMTPHFVSAICKHQGCILHKESISRHSVFCLRQSYMALYGFRPTSFVVVGFLDNIYDLNVSWITQITTHIHNWSLIGRCVCLEWNPKRNGKRFSVTLHITQIG